ETTIKGNRLMQAMSGRLLDFGIDLYKEVDRGCFSTHIAADGEYTSFWLLQGSFDRGRFEQAMSRANFHKLKNLPNTGYYQIPLADSKRSEFLAMPNANTLILTIEEQYVIEALVKGAGQKPAALNNKEVQAVLENLDDKPPIFLVAGGNFV